LDQPQIAQCQAEEGLKTIQESHTCRHRVDELLEVIHQ